LQKLPESCSQPDSSIYVISRCQNKSTTISGMSKTLQNGSELAISITQKTWLHSVSSTQRVVKHRKRGAPPQETFEEVKQRHYEEQRRIWSHEGVFWCKNTETFESRCEGQPNKPVSGHWFHNKCKGVCELYTDLRQTPVETKEVVFFT
jgi:hypothetical protein